MSKLSTLVDHVKTASIHRPIPLQILDLLTHKFKLNIGVTDYYRLKFYQGSRSWQQKERYVGEGGSIYWPFAGNKFKFASMLTDKYIQKGLLRGFGLPTPDLLAVVGKNYEIATRGELVAFLEKTEKEMVIKPASNSAGQGILVIRKRDGRIYSGGTETDIDSIWLHMEKYLDRGLLIEERVENVAELRQLNPSSLNTYRVVTIRTRDGNCHIAAVALKFGSKGSVVDNGSARGIQINYDPEGEFLAAYDYASNTLIDVHPDTGVSLNQIDPVGLSEISELAINASEKFSFHDTVGWDIAVTTRGAVIIEGNLTYELLSLQAGTSGLISDELAMQLPRYNWMTRWDKSHLYPGYHRR